MNYSTSLANRPVGPMIVIVGLITAFAIGFLITQMQVTFITVGILCAYIFIISLFSVPLSLYLLIASMLLSPELMVAQTAVREVTIRFDDVILTAMIFSWLLRMAVFKDVGIVVRSRLTRPIVIYSIIIMFATGLGIWRNDVNPLSGTFFVLKIIEYFILYIMIVNYIRDFDMIQKMLTAILLVGGAITLYGLTQAFIGGSVAAPFEGSTGERNTFSGYLVLVGGVAAGVFFFTENRRERRILAFMFPVVVATLLLSISRSGWISAAVVMMVLYFFAPNKGYYLIALIVFVAVLPFIVPQVVIERLDFTFNQQFHPGQMVNIGGINLDTSTSARILSAQYILQSITKHPFLGYGITGFSFIDGQYFRILIEVGIIGLASFLWIMRRIHGLLKEVIRTDLPPRIYGMTVGFYAGFWGLMVHALSANTFIIVRISEPFWCLAGMVTVTMALVEQKALTKPIEKDIIS